MHKKFAVAVTTSLLGSLGFNGDAVAATDFGVTLGTEFTSGKYGSSDTTRIVTLPLGIQYKTDNGMATLTIPWVSMSGPGDVRTNGVRYKSTTSTRTVTESGLGDVTLAYSHGIYVSDDAQLRFGAGGKVKFGTANTRIGTGENDYAVQLFANRSSGSFTAMLSIGYQALGSPAGQQLNNGYFGGLGGYFQADEHTGLGAEFNASQTISVTGTEQRELRIYWSEQVAKTSAINIYLLKGYADGSPDQGMGVQFNFGL